jgi:hypothetical protein
VFRDEYSLTLDPVHSYPHQDMKRVIAWFSNVRRVFTVLPGLFLANLSWAGGSAEILDETHASVRAVAVLQNIVTPEIIKWQDVLGTAIGIDGVSQPHLVVYVENNQVSPGAVALALRVLNIPARVEPTEKIVAYRGKPQGGGGTSHTALQTPPIQLGTSGGWRNDLANGYCCGGTLGSSINVNGVQYIMSNYHVFESDIVPGGNGIVATDGSSVIQPGLIDVGCNASRAQNVGTLHKLSSLPSSNVDVSIAQANAGMVRTDGAILEIGTISASTVAAFLSQPVKKSGRTTGLSRSSINGLNATISVQYENECAGGVAFTKTFTNQIVIANSGSSFLNSGDSGSLMVEDVATNPRAIGLLYAGSSTMAVANSIGEVLQFVGNKLNGTATMVGN